MVETERTIKPLLTSQPGDRGERHDNTADGNYEHLNYVALFVMADFMCENRFQFGLGELCDERVEQNDFSKTSEPGEERVGVSRAFDAIHYFDTASGETSSSRQC